MRKQQRTPESRLRSVSLQWTQTQQKKGPLAGCRSQKNELLDVLYSGAKCGHESSSSSKDHPELELCFRTQSVDLDNQSTCVGDARKSTQRTPNSTTPGCVPHASSTSCPRGGISTRELRSRLLARLSVNFHAATYPSRYNSVREVHIKPASLLK